MNKAHFLRTYRPSIEKLENRFVFAGASITKPAALAAVIAGDRLENNDSRSTAYNVGSLSTGTKTYANLTMEDVADFYKFSIPKAGTANTKVFVTLLHKEGDLDVTLYSANGSLLRTSATTKDQESISLSGLAAGTYYVKVYGYRGAKSPNYKLSLTTTGAVPTPVGPTTPTPPVVPPVVPPSVIDLVGSALTATDSTKWKSTITVVSRVSNTGSTVAGAFNVQYFISRDKIASNDDLLLIQSNGSSSVVVREFAAGGSSTVIEATLAMPAMPANWTGESFYVVMKTDSAAQIVETNEANNSGQAGESLDWESITVLPADPSNPEPIPSQFNIRLNLTGMTPSQAAVFQAAAKRWSEIIIGDLPAASYNGVSVDDLLIDARLAPIDGVSGILGHAGPDEFRAGSFLPYHGTMEFDTADIVSMQADGTFFSVIMHEMGHVLGVGTIWEDKRLLTGAGTSNPRFIGPNATAAYNQIFGKNETGVPVENTGGPGTRDGHWRENIFKTELMTGFAEDSPPMPISLITVGSLLDLGYVVDMNAADAYTKPLVAGASSSALLSESLPAIVGSFLVSGEDYDQALNSLIGISNVTSTKNSFVPTIAKATSGSSLSGLASDSVRKSYVRATSEVFANDTIYSSRSLASVSSLGTSTRKSSSNLLDTLFASEF